MRMITINYVKLYMRKESGNMYLKDRKTGESKPLKYCLCSTSDNPIGLKDYMNIRRLSIKEAVDELESCNVVLIGHTFDIMFYSEDDKNMLWELLSRLS